MKHRITFGVVAIAVLAGVAWLFTPPPPLAVQGIRFAGFTNGIVGAVAPVFGSLTTNHAATIQRWLAAGTNAAEFTITNQQSCAIWLYPLGRICTDEAQPMRDETPLLNAPNFSGIRIASGQAATVQVAVLPHQAPWRLQLYYHRDSCSDTFMNRLRLLPQSLRAMTGRSMQMQVHTIESDLIDR